uniref:Uncharacterized protein n=1 Tax=Strongyloides venezuelensis TaxID=75913 RepID=A0A0K0FGL7_STRVS
MGEEIQPSIDFKLELESCVLNVKVIVLEFCYIIYIGKKNSIEIMTMGNFGRSTLLDLSPGACSQMYVEGLNLKLSKAFPGKQIFINTDLCNDDSPEFWSEIFSKFVPKLKEVLC